VIWKFLCQLRLRWRPLAWLTSGVLIALISGHPARARKAGVDAPPARPRLVVQLGHSASVLAVAWSPDGRFVLTGSADHTACLWEAATGIEIQRFRGHIKAVHSVAFSLDGRSVMTGSFDQTIRFWDLTTGQERRRIQAGRYDSDRINFAALSPDGKYVLVVGDQVCLWNASTGQQERSLTGHTNTVNYAAFSHDSRFILTGSVDRTARLWEAATGKELHAFTAQVFKSHFMTGHGVIVPAVAFSRDDRYILMGGDVAILWDRETGQEVKRFATDGGEVASVAISPDGRYVLTGEDSASPSLAKKLRWWDAATGAELHSAEWPMARGSDDIMLAFSADSRSVLTACGESVISWEAESGQKIRSFEGYAAGVRAVAMSKDNRLLLTGSDFGGTQIWDQHVGQQTQRLMSAPSRAYSTEISAALKLLREAQRLDPAPLGAHSVLPTFDGITSLAVSTDGRTVLTGKSDGTAILWDASTAKPKQNLKVSQSGIEAVALSPDPEGRYALTGSRREAILWETATAKIIRRFSLGFSVTVWSVAFAPDGLSVITGSSGLMSGGAVCQWSVETGQQIKCLNIKGPTWRESKEKMDPSTNTGASTSAIPPLTNAQEEVLNNGIPYVAFSPDGRFIAVGKGNSMFDIRHAEVRVFEAATGKQLQYFVPPDDLNCITFSPDGNYLLTGGRDGIAYLWDRRTEREARRFAGHASAVKSATFTSDGRFVITGSEDGTTRFWNAQTAGELCQLISFNHGDWMVVDPEGRFDTNNLDEIRGLHWVMPDDPFNPLPLEIYMRDYYQPRLLTMLLSGQKPKEVKDLSRLNRAQPSVKITSVEQQKDNPELATVTVEVASASSRSSPGDATEARGVYDVRLFRDGQLVGQYPTPDTWEKDAIGFSRRTEEEKRTAWRDKTRVELDGAGQRKITFPVRLAHQEPGGEVQFSAYAFNSDRVKSLTHRSAFKLKPSLTPIKGRAFIVSVGVNRTESPGEWRLNFAVNDADQIQRALSAQITQTGEYREVIPIRLIAERKSTGEEIKQATKANLQAVLGLLAGKSVSPDALKLIPSAAKLRQAGKAEPEDLVIISISSHGVEDRGIFYLLPYDIGRGRGKTLTPDFLAQCISSGELAAWMRAIDAGAMILIVDACKSAAMVKADEFKPGPMGDPGLGQLAYDKGMQILAASQSYQEAGENASLQLSYLTQALINDGIKAGQADQAPQDGKITLSEWLNFGVKHVPELHAKEALQKQASKAAPHIRGGNRGIELIESDALQQPALFDFRRKLSEVILVKERIVR